MSMFLPVGENRIVGRLTGDNLEDLTPEEVVEMLGLDTVLTEADVIDEDDMASDSAVKVPTQQSVKKYVDDNAGGGGAVATDPTWQSFLIDLTNQSFNAGSITQTFGVFMADAGAVVFE